MLITWILSLLAAAGALVYVFMNYRQIKAMREGTPEMVEMSGIIRSGANTFMLTEYRTILIVVAVLAIVLSLFVEKTSGITFLIGAVMS
ncbi:MAG: sodium/proton-translocating pyrophosphatase, partial [Clostridia bacterium]|nr:sodium/proton-translocating pyrophosphatase [Clostridia bacterium]